MRVKVLLVVAVVCGVTSLAMSARGQHAPAKEGLRAELSGRWTSTEHVTFTNPSRAGSSFYLDIVIAKDGTFQGAWDAYTCFSYPGAFSTMTISCSRVKKAAKARGKLDLATGSGEIELERLGRTSLKYALGPKLTFELPKDWLKQGEPVLYTSQLGRKPRQ